MIQCPAVFVKPRAPPCGSHSPESGMGQDLLGPQTEQRIVCKITWQPLHGPPLYTSPCLLQARPPKEDATVGISLIATPIHTKAGTNWPMDTSSDPVLHCGQCSLPSLVCYLQMTSLGHDQGKHMPSSPSSLLILGILLLQGPVF